MRGVIRFNPCTVSHVSGCHTAVTSPRSAYGCNNLRPKLVPLAVCTTRGESTLCHEYSIGPAAASSHPGTYASLPTLHVWWGFQSCLYVTMLICLCLGLDLRLWRTNALTVCLRVSFLSHDLQASKSLNSSQSGPRTFTPTFWAARNLLIWWLCLWGTKCRPNLKFPPRWKKRWKFFSFSVACTNSFVTAANLFECRCLFGGTQQDQQVIQVNVLERIDDKYC